MSHRSRTRKTHEADIERRSQTSTDSFGEPVYERITVEEGVPVIARDPGGSYVREDTGERVRKSPTYRLPAWADVEEGDHLVIAGLGRLEVIDLAAKHGRHGLSHYELECEDV